MKKKYKWKYIKNCYQWHKKRVCISTLQVSSDSCIFLKARIDIEIHLITFIYKKLYPIKVSPKVWEQLGSGTLTSSWLPFNFGETNVSHASKCPSNHLVRTHLTILKRCIFILLNSLHFNLNRDMDLSPQLHYFGITSDIQSGRKVIMLPILTQFICCVQQVGTNRP